MIEIKNASKSFGEQVIFDKINVSIKNAGLYILQGESGSGKSTFLNLLAGYESFDEGIVEIDENITPIFQSYELINELSVKENIYIQAEKEDDTQNIIKKLGLDELMDHYCNELSGGQKQRVGIARALLLQPNIILCDEPTESLDIDNKHIVMNLFKELSKNKVVIIASHDQQMIDEYADAIISIENKKIFFTKELKVFQEIQKREKKSVDEKKISFLVHKIIRRKTMFFSLLLVTLVLLLEGLFIFQKTLFYQPETTNTVNADMAYIKLYDKYVELDEYDLEKEELTPIINFVNVQLDGKEMISNVYPYVNGDLKYTGKLPDANEILINQNVANVLKDWEGKKIEFNYLLANEHLTKVFTICGVVDETDTEAYNFYYDLESLTEEFKNTYLTNGMSCYQFLNENSTFFQKKIGYSNVVRKYKEVLSSSNVYIFNPLYEERMEFDQNSMVYRVLFIIFEMILVVGIIVLILVYLYRDTNQFLNVCSIFVSLLVPSKLMWKNYILYKILYFIPLVMISSIALLGIYYSYYSDIYVSIAEYNNIIYFVLGLCIIYLIMLFVNMKRFRKNKINNILKNNKD